jgi:hypothetical protein
MEEFKICTECIRPEICLSRCECSIIVHSHEAVAKVRNEEAFMSWINDHATNRDIGREGSAG